VPVSLLIMHDHSVQRTGAKFGMRHPYNPRDGQDRKVENFALPRDTITNHGCERQHFYHFHEIDADKKYSNIRQPMCDKLTGCELLVNKRYISKFTIKFEMTSACCSR